MVSYLQLTPNMGPITPKEFLNKLIGKLLERALVRGGRGGGGVSMKELWPLEEISINGETSP